MREKIIEKLPKVIKEATPYLENERWMITGSLAAYLQGVDVDVNDVDILLVKRRGVLTNPTPQFYVQGVSVHLIRDPSLLLYSYKALLKAYERRKVVESGGIQLPVAPLEWLASIYRLEKDEGYKKKISKIKSHPSFDEKFYKEIKDKAIGTSED